MNLLTSDSDRTSTRARKDLVAAEWLAAIAYVTAAGTAIQPASRSAGEETYSYIALAFERSGAALTQAFRIAREMAREDPPTARSDDFQALLAQIEQGQPPALAPDRRQLAEETIRAQDERANENIQDWARRLANVVSKADD